MKQQQQHSFKTISNFQLMVSNLGRNSKIKNDVEHEKSVGDQRRQFEIRLYNTTHKLLTISQIFLSAPTAVQKPKIRAGLKDKILYAIHLVWSVCIYIGLAACIYDESTSSNADLPTVQKPLYFSEYLVYLIHILEIVCRTYRGREKFWIFFALIIDFDCGLFDLQTPISYRSLSCFLRTHLLLIVLHLLSTFIVGFFYSDGIWLSFFRTSIVYLLPNVIIHISLIHYYGLLFVIAERSEKLYALLRQLLADSKQLQLQQSSIFRIRLHLLRSLYAKLEQLTRDVNDAFSYSIVLVYVGSFINISINIFLLYKYFSAWNTAGLAWTGYSAVWTCMHIAKMSLILYYNEDIQNKKTQALHLLSTFRYEDMALEPPVRHFMLQLMSDTRSNVICGMAALNLNFITSILVATSTLFIFLVQYDITFEALAKAQNSGKSTGG
ncbi:putative gustatory receptor 59f [Stomoxys calcitrans]|uniref:putative gustatory receptor 59f n=1 Tax=Stomoxys calcitrans TaxID=35570 RepID=UPI0027E2BE72|nr:putative gustatory receptor 59f [Stomoxys calcitrans]